MTEEDAPASANDNAFVENKREGDNGFEENSREGRPPLSPAAKRALAEAEERRVEIDKIAEEMPKEIGGRGGTEPVRYGDWEVKGITSDF